MPDQTPTVGIALTKSIDLRPQADPVRERAKVAKLAQEFEAMLLLQMIRGMRQALLDEPSEGEGLGGASTRDTFDVELTRRLAQAGGFGLGAVLSAQVNSQTTAADKARELSTVGAISGAFLKLPDTAPSFLPLKPDALIPLGVGPLPSAPAAPTPLAISPARPRVSADRQSSTIDGRDADAVADNSRLSMPLDGVTTSAFGWRSDPLNGRSTFHHGVDLRAAYGAEVPAAAEGQVVFAGERGGYGNMVVVQHANGVETRYAHLSAIQVAEGVTVATGTPVGRVGSTGRSTAPHLHFEVLVNGERVDPERATARLGRGPLKFESLADD